jgi:NAD(P)-dependent dehydrogenase (short-subunit alcohol dehydrogenase family)
MGRLDGEVVLVTGASSGIGEGLAGMLAGHGAAVALMARREEELRRVAEKIEAAGGTALVVPADVERDDDLAALPGRVRAELGPVDILVNAAGVAAFQPVHEIDPPTLDRQWRINLRAPTLLCAAVLPQMRERRHGVVINLASEAGVVTYPGLGAYAITKHGVCALTRLVAEENQEFGIKAWAICPGMVDTPMTDDAPETARRRFLRVEDVVSVVDGLLLQDANVKMGPEILMRTMRNPWG